MKILIRDGKVIGSATDAYTGPEEYLQIDEPTSPLNLDNYSLVEGTLVYAEPIPQEVTMGQCRLALYDIHGIEDDAEFLGLTDLLPENQRARARLELRTRTSVRYDNELVVALCEAKGWDRDELFTRAALL